MEKVSFKPSFKTTCSVLILIINKITLKKLHYIKIYDA